MSQDNNIKVVARFRPPNALEKRSGETSVVEVQDETTVDIKCDEHTGAFTFDRVFGPETTQAEIYGYAISDTLDDIFNGYNGTVFCYGQTGSGKTFTMMGADIDSEELRGIIPRIVEGVFGKIVESPPTVEYMVKASYMEIYMERIRDLLSPEESNLSVHEDKANGVYVKGLMEVFVSSIDEVYQVMRQGAKSRVVAQTNMNAESSRSHSIFQLTIEQKDTVNGKTKMGRLFLVDLAGSEKVGKTGATGQTLEEAKKINKSLSALGMVINALTDGKSTHIPYRDSKLTRILQESLGGNSRTTLIINCSPAAYNASETVGTLRFGMRAKSIKNKAKVNQDFSPAELKLMLKKSRAQAVTYQTYISALEGEVKVWRTGGAVESEHYATWERVTAKDRTPAPMTPSSKSSAARASTPRPGARHYSVSAGTGNAARSLSPTPTGARMASPTPTLLHESLLSELTSRSGSPTIVMSEDEREEFLRRENELNDAIADKEHELQESLRLCAQMREELEFQRSESHKVIESKEELGTQIAQLQLNLDKISFSHKEAMLTVDSLNEANSNLKASLDTARTEMEQRMAAGDGDDVDRDQVRAARMAEMLNGMASAQAFSRHEAGMGDLLRSLVEAGDDQGKKVEMIMQARRELDEARDALQDKDDQICELTKRNEDLTVQCSDIDSKYERLLAEYEEMLEQSIDADEQASTRDSETLNDIKQKLETHYNSKIAAQKAQLESAQADVQRRQEEAAKSAATVRELRSENRELQAKIEALVEKSKLEIGGGDATAAAEHAMRKEREMTAMRRDMAQRILEYDTMRKSLMRDVQNRCEKIIELEMALDEKRSQIAVLTSRLSNSGQPQRMHLLEKNVAQLTQMQKDLVDQNTELKKKDALSERMLLGRTDRITYLEARLQDATNQAEAWKRKTEELQSLRYQDAKAIQPSATNVLRFSRIAKPMRGGGGGAVAAIAGPDKPPAAPASSGFFGWGAN
ncbi:hypothetical protein LPJ61_004416 [Coemansia biformis]|uniref:Kinesin-like protein n=1 Tax=Coemansia biformis TaxID=1286918 RepID=A0A9W7YB27_9FUNG|nr:hypothetical protein LPJ61_004416 [Coemansia biformis]